LGSAAALAAVGTAVGGATFLRQRKKRHSPYVNDEWAKMLRDDDSFFFGDAANSTGPVLKIDAVPYVLALYYGMNGLNPAEMNYFYAGRDALQREGYPMGDAEFLRVHADPRHMTMKRLKDTLDTNTKQLEEHNEKNDVFVNLQKQATFNKENTRLNAYNTELRAEMMLRTERGETFEDRRKGSQPVDSIYDYFLRPPNNKSTPLLKKDALSFVAFLMSVRNKDLTTLQHEFMLLGRDRIKNMGYVLARGEEKAYIKGFIDPAKLRTDHLLLKIERYSKSKNPYHQMYVKELEIKYYASV
jgi:hypothetical protein